MDRYIMLLICFMATGQLVMQAQEDEVMRGVGKINAPEALDEGRNLLFVIGIDNYPNWFKLNNAVSDARGIQEAFMEKFGFEPVLPPLFNDEASRDNIINSFDLMRSKIKPDDSLVIFYAGHGETRKDSIGDKVLETGYIIPFDGEALERQKWASYIGIQEFMANAARLPARHITLILDACHSGIALGDDATQFRGTSSAPPPSLVNKISRRVMTSARGDQLASDKGPVGEHSLFTGMLVQGLRTGASDLDKDGLITSTELGLYLQQSVSKYSGDLQTPDFGTFQLDNRGDMVLRMDGNTPAILTNNAINQWQNGKIADFRETFLKLRAVDSTSLQFLYMQSLYGLATNSIDLSISSLEERAEREKDELPERFRVPLVLAREEIQRGFEYWQHFLETDLITDSWIEVNMLVNGVPETPDAEKGSAYRYELPAEEDLKFQFEIKNLKEKSLFVYAIIMDQLGEIRALNLWPDNKPTSKKGLDPQRAETTFAFRSTGLAGLEVVRFFVSEEPIEAFEYPAHWRAEEEPPRPEGPLGSHTVWLVFQEN